MKIESKVDSISDSDSTYDKVEVDYTILGFNFRCIRVIPEMEIEGGRWLRGTRFQNNLKYFENILKGSAMRFEMI